MQTTHKVYFEDAGNMHAVAAESIDLVVTSPPYPMIKMWDAMFARQNPGVHSALQNGDAAGAFELMHRQLDAVWHEIYRVLKKGGLACINIGDAVRSVGTDFALYPNHARILSAMVNCGFSVLPAILWRKPTNAPNKFMGSGMLPAGAYVTLEHEYILVFRKGSKRQFTAAAEKQTRKQSALFWEERNLWYSDIWLDLKGAVQKLDIAGARCRSGAFPFELPYRLINMFSVKGDTVLDPFLGTGTTLQAAMATGRNSLGFELEPGFHKDIFARLTTRADAFNRKINDRLQEHIAFIQASTAAGVQFKHLNRFYKFPVKTGQEKELLLDPLESIRRTASDTVQVTYAPAPAWQFDWNGSQSLLPEPAKSGRRKNSPASLPRRAVQKKLF